MFLKKKKKKEKKKKEKERKKRKKRKKKKKKKRGVQRLSIRVSFQPNVPKAIDQKNTFTKETKAHKTEHFALFLGNICAHTKMQT